MTTLIIAAAFSGTRSQFRKALLICLCIDSLIVLSCMNLSCKQYSPLDNHTEYILQHHNTNCQYEQGECPEVLCSHHDTASSCDNLLEYQIRLEMDSAFIYDNGRYVGALPFDSTQAFDKLMMKDNE